MDVLILMRHGKAVRDSQAPSDRARGLTSRGAREAMLAGAHMVEAGLKPDRILVSAAERTRQTYAALAAGFRATPEFLEPLYMASSDTIWHLAADSGGEIVLAIGHNPGMHELASALLDQAAEDSAAAESIRADFPTSAFAAFAFTRQQRAAPLVRLIASWSPKD
jgi:phosphohistidine phosphatase